MEEEEIWAVYRDNRGKGSRGALWELSTFGHVKKNGKEYIPKDGRYLVFGCGYIHRAVAELFIPNPENKPCIDHVDRNKHNNHVSNLSWCTYSENMTNIDKEAFRKKISESSIGRKFSEETKRKISESHKGDKNPFYGKKHTIESKHKMSESHKGQIPYIKGKHLTKEIRKKISESNKGKHSKKLSDLSKSAI